MTTLGHNNVEGQESMLVELLVVDEPALRRQVLFLPLLMRVLHHCLDCDEVELEPGETSH